MLLDSNIIIYSVKPQYPEVRSFLKAHDLSASLISYVEVLGYHGPNETNREKLERLFGVIAVEPITEAIATQAAALRRQRQGLKTVDAIIAATALETGNPLVTHNRKDFDWIEELEIIDPVEGA